MAQKLVDLTGATVRVPAGWSLGDLGTYTLYGIVSYYSTGAVPIHNTFVFDMLSGRSTGIRFSDTAEATNKTISSGAFDLEITGGLDTTNSNLIQWFLDNNATIEGGVWEEERTIQGKWKFNESISMGNFLWTEQTVNFTSNGTQYSSMRYTTVSEELAELYYDSTRVKNFGYITNWINEAYRDVDFGSTEQNVSDGFYTYITSNATQVEEEEKKPILIKNPIILIGSKAKKVVVDNINMTIDVYTKEVPVTLITFTINGTSYQAEEGMTWSEWVDSEYDINDYFAISGGTVWTTELGKFITAWVKDVTPSDVIQANMTYTYDKQGSSND